MFCSKRANWKTYFFFLSWNANTNTLQQRKRRKQNKIIETKKNKMVVDVDRVKNRRWNVGSMWQDRDCIFEEECWVCFASRDTKSSCTGYVKLGKPATNENKKKEQNYLYRKKTIRKKMIHNATHTHTLRWNAGWKSKDTTQPKTKKAAEYGRRYAESFYYLSICLVEKCTTQKHARKAKRNYVSSVILLPIMIRSINQQHQIWKKKIANEKHSEIQHGTRPESEREGAFFVGRAKQTTGFFSPFFFTTCRARGHLLDVFLLLINNGKTPIIIL